MCYIASMLSSSSLGVFLSRFFILNNLFKCINVTFKLNTTLFPIFNFMTFHQMWFINWTVWKIGGELVDVGLNFVPAVGPLHNSPELTYCSWEAKSDIQVG